MFAAFYNFCWQTRKPGKSGQLRPAAAMMAEAAGHVWNFDKLFDAVLAAEDKSMDSNRAKIVAELRRLTDGAPIAKCLEALEASGWDIDAAMRYMRSKWVHEAPMAPSGFWEQSRKEKGP